MDETKGVMRIVDKEKIIKGLEVHKAYGDDCAGCPYECNDREICVEDLCSDAIELINEQAERIYLLEERIGIMGGCE